MQERGWFDGAGECARVLAAETSEDVIEGSGFGGSWPLVVSDDSVLAPAMPVAVGIERESGNDGEYHRRSEAIWREAVGSEEPFLTTDQSAPPPGQPFDLLWFGEHERFALRSGFLEVSDLFGELRVPARPDLLERLLLRRKRLPPEILKPLHLNEVEGAQTIEVRRPALLSSRAQFLDPIAFLTARTDVESALQEGDLIALRTVRGTEGAFEVLEHTSGWRLVLRSGTYMFTRIDLEKSGPALSVRAFLTDELDGLAPGVRGRLIFDLRSDLVAIG